MEEAPRFTLLTSFTLFTLFILIKLLYTTQCSRCQINFALSRKAQTNLKMSILSCDFLKYLS